MVGFGIAPSAISNGIHLRSLDDFGIVAVVFVLEEGISKVGHQALTCLLSLPELAGGAGGSNHQHPYLASERLRQQPDDDL